MAKEDKNTLQGIQAFAPVADTGKCATRSAILSPDSLKELSSSMKPIEDNDTRSSNLALTSQSLHGISSHTKDFAKPIKTNSELAREAESILGPNMLEALRGGSKESEKKTLSQEEGDGGEGNANKDGEEDPRQSMHFQKRRGEPGICELGGKGSHHSPTRNRELGGKGSHHSPTRNRELGGKGSHHSPTRNRELGGKGSRHSRSPNRKTKGDSRKPKPTKTRGGKKSGAPTNLADGVGSDLEDNLDDYDLGPGENEVNNPQGRVRKTRQSRRRDDAKRGGRRSPVRNGARRKVGSPRNVHQEQLAQLTNVDQTKVFRESDIIYAETSESESENEEEIDSGSGHSGVTSYVTSALSGAAVVSAASAERAAALAAGGAVAATGTVYHAATAAGGTMLNYGGTVFNALNTAVTTRGTGRGTHQKSEINDFDSGEEDGPVEKPGKSLALLIS